MRGAVAGHLPRGLAAAARTAIRIADRALADAGREPGTRGRMAGLACRAGCSWCCHQMVGITPAEQALLAEGVLALPAGERARIRGSVAAAVNRTRGLDQRQWWAARLPCPLLAEDGRCAVHSTRPLPCRGYNSADAEHCRRSLEGEATRVPVLAVQWGIYGHAQAGLAQALAAAGIAPGPVSLVDALAAVLA
ncbi:MAG: YkgJ family cysteine cluster protein [Magnetospirillum sp.]|nr:YkgJ family cysteine cluster protein [Magnetospirillum sp.]